MTNVKIIEIRIFIPIKCTRRHIYIRFIFTHCWCSEIPGLRETLLLRTWWAIVAAWSWRYPWMTGCWKKLARMMRYNRMIVRITSQLGPTLICVDNKRMGGMCWGSGAVGGIPVGNWFRLWKKKHEIIGDQLHFTPFHHEWSSHSQHWHTTRCFCKKRKIYLTNNIVFTLRIILLEPREQNRLRPYVRFGSSHEQQIENILDNFILRTFSCSCDNEWTCSKWTWETVDNYPDNFVARTSSTHENLIDGCSWSLIIWFFVRRMMSEARINQ